MCWGGIWTQGGFTFALFQGWDGWSEVLVEQVQLNFSYRYNFTILLPYGLLVDNIKSSIVKVLLASLIWWLWKQK